MSDSKNGKTNNGKEKEIDSSSYYDTHKEERKEYSRRYYEKWRMNGERYEEFCKRSREYHRKLRLEVIIHYGGNPPKCACCGETELDFLTIDHINNDGAKHRKQHGHNFLPNWLKKNDFPEGFRVLCYNCNCGRRINNGVCPHKKRM